LFRIATAPQAMLRNIDRRDSGCLCLLHFPLSTLNTQRSKSGLSIRSPETPRAVPNRQLPLACCHRLHLQGSNTGGAVCVEANPPQFAASRQFTQCAGMESIRCDDCTIPNFLKPHHSRSGTRLSILRHRRALHRLGGGAAACSLLGSLQLWTRSIVWR
jgi:hypothetical protein